MPLQIYHYFPQGLDVQTLIKIDSAVAAVRMREKTRFRVGFFLLPAALREAQTCRYLVYSEANFEVFRPAGATRCTDGGEIWSPPPCQISPPSVQREISPPLVQREIWHGGGDQISPPSVQWLGYRTHKTEIFTQI